MKKKLISLLLCATMVLTVFSGCGKTDSEEEAKSQAALEGGSESQDSNGIFTYAIGGDTGNTLNPLTADDRWGLMTCHLLYSPAYFIYPDGTIDYILAESMEPSEDGLVYTMKLKEGLQWSDGEALTADDIVYTYETINSTNENLYIGGEPIKVEKVDDLTVTFTLPAVSASVMELLSAEISILPKHVFENRGSFDVNMLEEEFVCSGPYTLEEYKTGQYLKFKKNPNYPNGEANIDTIVYQIIENSDTASLALQNGEVDAWIALPDQMDPFIDNESFSVTNYSEGRVAYLRLNSASENMQDKEYREGILYALNREEIMLASYSDEDFYDIGYSFLPVTSSYYTDDVEKWDQDLEKAQELVANGPKSLKICYTEEDSVQKSQALTIQAELKAIGIELELVGLNQAAFMSAAYDNSNGDYDIYLGGYVMGVDPDMYAPCFVSTKDNYVNYNNKEIDELFEKGSVTLDETERKEIYAEVQRKVSEEAIFYPFGSNLRTLVTSSRVGGMDEAGLVPIYTFGDLSKLTVN